MPKKYSETKTCPICDCTFTSKHRERKKCYECGPLRKDRLSKSDPPATEKRCSKCLEHKPLNEFNKCRKSRHGVVSECKVCRRKYRQSSKYTLTCSVEGCDNSFVSTVDNPRKCLSCGTPRIKSSNALCRYVAPFYDNMKEFQDCHSGLYQHADKYGILEEIREHMLPVDCPFSRTGFISHCDKNDGFGVFYILKCYDDSESFCKFGITSHNIDTRYYYEMDYEYDVLISINAPAGFIWDLERYIQKITGKVRYSPQIPFGGSVRECFKCNSNNLLFKSLMSIDPYLQSA